MSQMPFFVTSRSESCAKRRGTQESTAMLARTRGPAEEAGLGGDEEQAPAETSVSATRTGPMAKPPSVQSPKIRSAKTAFIVLARARAAPRRADSR